MRFKSDTYISWHHNWDRVDNTDDPGWFVKFLDSSRLRQLDYIKHNPAEYFSYLEVRPNLHILDLGCGTGILLHPLAELVGKKGRVVGVDISDFMVREARKRAGITDLPLEFYKGNVYSLDFPDELFDRATCSTLFQHLKRPLNAMNEIKRVVKTGGLISIFDHDWDSLKINSRYNNVSKLIFDYFCNSLKNATAGKQLESIFKSSGIEIKREYKLDLNLNYNEFLSSDIGFYQASQLCVNEGIITAEEKKLWFNDLAEKNDEGNFRFEFSGYRYVGRKV